MPNCQQELIERMEGKNKETTRDKSSIETSPVKDVRRTRRRWRSFGTMQRLGETIISSLETFFYNWGHTIAIRPWIFIISCILLTLVCSIGLLRFTPENRPDRLWVPWNSNFVKDSDWLRQNFPSPIRFHYAIITAENVLEPRIISMLQDIHERAQNLKTPGMKSFQFQWNDICFKLPVTKFLRRKRRKRQLQENDFEDAFFTNEGVNPKLNTSSSNNKDAFYDPSIALGQETYCDILKNLEEECWESNIAELWGFNATLIGSITKDDILTKLNNNQFSPIFGRSVDYTLELGDVTKNKSGHIIQAKAIMVRWFSKINQTSLNEGKIENDLGTGESVDKVNLLWETELSKLLKSYPLPENVSLYFSVARSFGDISGATIMGDASMLAVGFSIVFIYVIFMLGQCNLVEQRPMLSLAGLSCVGLAIAVSYGICSACGAIYGPVHNVLPFLLLGIGIDDMFVIMQCWNNLTPDERRRSLPERTGLTLQHAGVSITVTSITDFVAFAIGGTTVLPALQSFCLFAALGILATFIFQATFFVAWFVLDQKRIEARRNAFFIWHKHKNFQPNNCSQRNWAQLFFEKIYCKVLFYPVTKVLVFMTTFALLGVNVWGNMELRQEFDPIWFLPQDSYLFKYFMARDKYFPERGAGGFVLLYNVSYPDKLKEIDSLMQELQAFPHIHEIESWYSDFKEYVRYNFKKDILNTSFSAVEFQKYLGRFLFSPIGSKFRGRLKLNGNLTCGSPAPSVLISNIGFKFKIFRDSDEHIPVMNKIKDVVKQPRISNAEEESQNRAFVWSFAFAGWETDEIITAELYRNMSLAMICVLLTTLILIANLKTCIMVLTCVIFTLVDVGGSMHFWKLTIDTVSCIDLVLAIGLCVDYAAHIGHAFMKCEGASRNDRAQQALINIGPAVLNGGFSTFLAFVLLANSKSHVFLTFFKIFFLVVVYGLYHGLVFLPVLLSVIGPPPYSSVVSTNSYEKENKVPLEEIVESQAILLHNKNSPTAIEDLPYIDDDDED